MFCVYFIGIRSRYGDSEFDSIKGKNVLYNKREREKKATHANLKEKLNVDEDC